MRKLLIESLSEIDKDFVSYCKEHNIKYIEVADCPKGMRFFLNINLVCNRRRRFGGRCL